MKEDGRRSGAIRSSTRRVKRIFRAMASLDRIEILRVLKSKGPLTYSELKLSAGFKTAHGSGKFAYHLRKLREQTLVRHDRVSDRYNVTSMGDSILNLGKQIETMTILDTGKLLVRTSRGSIEKFDPQKITQSLLNEGNLALDLAQNITEDVERRIYKHQMTYLTSPLIRDIVNCVLLENGYEDVRNRLVRLGLPAHDVQKVIRNISSDSRDVEGVILHAGQSVYAELLLTNILLKSITDKHLDGEVHVANLGLWPLIPDIIFLNMKDLIVDGVNAGSKRSDISSVPAAANLDELATLITMATSMAYKEASQEVVMDGLPSLLSKYVCLPGIEGKLACALMASSTAASIGEAQTMVSFRLVLGQDSETTSIILNAYKRYAECTKEPRIGLVIDYDKSDISSVSEKMAEIVKIGGRLAAGRGHFSECGVPNVIGAGQPSMYLASLSVNLPRIALMDPNSDELYFRTNVAILMRQLADMMQDRKERVMDLIRKGLNPFLTNTTRHLQRGNVYLLINMMGLRETVFDILGLGDTKEGRAALDKAVATANDAVAKKGIDNLRICMLEYGSASRLFDLDMEKYGKNRLDVINSHSYSASVAIDASKIQDASTKSDIIAEANRMARIFGGGVQIDLEFDADAQSVKSSLEKAAELLSFFRPRIKQGSGELA